MSSSSCRPCATSTATMWGIATSPWRTCCCARAAVCSWISARPCACEARTEWSCATSQRPASGSTGPPRCMCRGSGPCRSSAQRTACLVGSCRSPTTVAAAKSCCRPTQCPLGPVQLSRMATQRRQRTSLLAASAPSCSSWANRRGPKPGTWTPPSPLSGAMASRTCFTSGEEAASAVRVHQPTTRRASWQGCSASTPRGVLGWRSASATSGWPRYARRCLARRQLELEHRDLAARSRQNAAGCRLL
mmetsp:Transcript_94065/g.303891  ORF Transcript_94065/g.303891 Transcript_94065/m.303891 type:complete len:247 (+) Transcript_94065:1060-1800(+)